ncbi:MAG TPA: acyloxyacyl hydrolase [Terriglobales bacterium]|nr:acyloxyacyl hydrolase [Terriglobales bacterium]
MNWRNSFSWAALPAPLGKAVLALLLAIAPLQAQTRHWLMADPTNCATPADQLDDYGRQTPEVGVSLDGQATSAATAVNGAALATDVPSETYLWDCSNVFVESCVRTTLDFSLDSGSARLPAFGTLKQPDTQEDEADRDSKPMSVEPVRRSQPADLYRGIYYRNKLEFSLDGGWLPVNIPFAFDVFLGDGYNMTPLRYTLVPIIASLRWHMTDVAGPGILRGNWDLTFSGSVTAIPRGPETRYFSYIMGIRRNFVPRNERIAPYFDGRLGLGNIDAKGPKGVAWAQGQDFTFTFNLGSGVRYNFNSRYSISTGINYMHISNLYLSEPKYGNYGINVYGPMVGIDIRLGKQHQDATQ